MSASELNLRRRQSLGGELGWLEVRPDVRDRQTDVRQMSDVHYRLMPLP